MRRITANGGPRLPQKPVGALTIDKKLVEAGLSAVADARAIINAMAKTALGLHHNEPYHDEVRQAANHLRREAKTMQEAAKRFRFICNSLRNSSEDQYLDAILEIVPTIETWNNITEANLVLELAVRRLSPKRSGKTGSTRLVYPVVFSGLVASEFHGKFDIKAPASSEGWFVDLMAEAWTEIGLPTEWGEPGSEVDFVGWMGDQVKTGIREGWHLEFTDNSVQIKRRKQG